MQLKYDKLFGNGVDNSDFWPSFTDMLTTILLVIILVFTSMVGNYTKALDAKEAEVKEQAQALATAEETIESILGVKGDIIESLQSAFEANNIGILIDPDTGDIHVDSNILFDHGSSELRPEAKEHLREFIPLYIESLFQYEENIEEIIVEGHTDDVGSYMYNLGLSQDRALSVVKYVLSDEFGSYPHKDKVRDRLTANGKSFSHLIRNEDGSVNANESRRVIFKFRTTLENALKEELTDTVQ